MTRAPPEIDFGDRARSLVSVNEILFIRPNALIFFFCKFLQDIFSSPSGRGNNIIFINLLNAEVHIHNWQTGWFIEGNISTYNIIIFQGLTLRKMYGLPYYHIKIKKYIYNRDLYPRPFHLPKRWKKTSANVIYCIACTLCKKLYIGETGRRLGDRFQEYLRDVKTIKTHLNRSRDTLICPIISSNIWQSAASPYIKEARKAAKL